MSSYRTLTDLTSEIIVMRSKCYRGLVIAFVMISLGSVCGAIATMSLWPATGLLFLIPAYGLFLIFDTNRLSQWRTQVLAAWISKVVDLSALRQAITANKALPEQTLEGMLETLPEAGDLVAEQSVPISIRESLAGSLMACDHILCIKLICRALIHIIIIATMLSAMILGSWIPLSGLITIPLLLIISVWSSHRRILKAVNHAKNYRESTDFNVEKYTEIAKTVNWQGLSSKEKQRLLMFEFDS